MSRSPAATIGLIAAAVALTALAPPRGRCGEDYIVARGDTLSHIAQRCRSSVTAIAQASRVANPNLIRVGQRLVIPQLMAAAARHRGHAAGPGPSATHGAAANPGYRFQRGDTLYSLARWAEVSLPALLAANRGVDPRNIEIGDTIRLPVGAALPYPARLRERGASAAPERYDAPRYESPRREAPPRRPVEVAPDPDKEPEPEGM